MPAENGATRHLKVIIDCKMVVPTRIRSIFLGKPRDRSRALQLPVRTPAVELASWASTVTIDDGYHDHMIIAPAAAASGRDRRRSTGARAHTATCTCCRSS